MLQLYPKNDVTNVLARDFPLVNAAKEESRTHETHSRASEMACFDDLCISHGDCSAGAIDAEAGDPTGAEAKS